MHTTTYLIWDTPYMRTYDITTTQEQAERIAAALQLRLGRPFEVRS